MAVVEIPKKDFWATINRFPLSKTTSSLSSFSNPRHPPSTPLHMFAESNMEDNIDKAKSVIEKWVLQESSSLKIVFLFEGNRKDTKSYLDCIKGLCRSMEFLISENPSSNKLEIAQKLMNISMKQLQKEFYQILSANSKYLDPELVSERSARTSLSSSNYSDDETDLALKDEISIVSDSQLSLIAMSDLKSIADCMIRAGYGRECVNIYKLIRKSIVDEGLNKLGIDNYSTCQINKMSSDVYEDTIENWLNAIQPAVKTLFQSERFLCDHVFSTSETWSEKCFNFISKEGALNSFKLPELVANRKRSPLKIFQLMDLYKTIYDLSMEIDLIFSYESLSSIRLQVLSCLQKLGDTIRMMVIEFESSIQNNQTKVKTAGGGIHPLTISVMNYLQFLSNYSCILDHIIAESPFPGETKFLIPSFNGCPIPALSMRIAWIIFILQCKIDSKAKFYKDVALSYLCLANNLRFIVRKVCTSNLKYLLGEEWILNHEKKVQKYVAKYVEIAWSKVIVCIPTTSDASLSAASAKKCIKKFNSAFAEARLKQTPWVVTDATLRDEIRVSIANMLVPAYRKLYSIYLAKFCEENNFEVDLNTYLSCYLKQNV